MEFVPSTALNQQFPFISNHAGQFKEIATGLGSVRDYGAATSGTDLGEFSRLSGRRPPHTGVGTLQDGAHARAFLVLLWRSFALLACSTADIRNTGAVAVQLGAHSAPPRLRLCKLVKHGKDDPDLQVHVVISGSCCAQPSASCLCCLLAVR
jgi:hypothetical protein